MSNPERVRVGIIGLGMVGYPIKQWFQDRGHVRGEDLFCFDTNPSLNCSDDVNEASVIFICVPTPPAHDGACDTSVVESAVRGISDGRVVVIKSTVPPGTTQRLQDRHPDLKLMFCPEFLTEKQAWADFVHPSRQLVGVTEQSLPHSVEVLQLLPQALFQRPDTPIYGGRLVVSATEAEMTKYASNVFGALKVVYANVLADIAWCMSRASGDDVRYAHVGQMLGADQRIGPAWLDVDYGDYCGFGGFCFPKDTAAFISFYEQLIGEFRNQAGGYAGVLEAGLDLLKSAYEYNRRLLQAQGLSVEDVSRHDKDIVLAKRQPVRVHP